MADRVDVLLITFTVALLGFVISTVGYGALAAIQEAVRYFFGA